MQTLFMIPEFTSRIYSWQYDPARHGEPSLCIPLQLQRLFARLELSELPAVKVRAERDASLRGRVA